ncbi:MAG: hypothetical protein LBT89_06810 [Planctomycetaceae bacterium]|jgi:hypothetical protein|nr:hypothetical protein [Planctomycetaceae bacterium]
MKYNILLTVFVTLFTGSLSAQVLQPAQFRHYIDTFNADDEETVKQTYPNDKAWEFLSQNMPLLDYPDKDLERTYYFRWWTYRKHIKSTPDGFVVTEFHPNVPWAGKHNTISCPAAHHYREGRWLHHNDFLNDYSVFWLRKGGALRSYSFWIADSILQQAAVTGKTDLAKELLPDLIKNYEAWQKERLDPNGLFWQRGDRDGGEMSVATEILKDDAHYRAQINSYMFAEAAAISQIAGLAGDAAAAEKFAAEAQRIKNLLHKNLWDADARFYKVAPRVKSPDDKLTLVNVRELHGYTPWYFAELNPPEEYTAAWEQLLDPQGFYAPFGPTTAEQRHPLYKISYKGHECQWNGPSWPFATAITLTGLANLINRDAAAGKDVTKLKDAYQKTLNCYVQSHTLKRDGGKTVSWIDENINPATGDWIARTRLKTWKNGTWDAGKGGYERGKDYNHSTFCDLIISGLIGFRPVLGINMVIYPLVPPDTAYFCLDAVKYHGHNITIFYDKDGSRYNRGKGFYVLDGGKEIVRLDTLPTKPLELSIPRPAGQR